MTNQALKGLKAYRRKFGEHLQPAFNNYTSLVGEVIWASNNLHAELLVLLRVIFPDGDSRVNRIFSENQDMAAELWHSLRSDDAQRGVLGAIVKHSTLLTSKQRSSIFWVLESARNLSSYRNDAVHTAFELRWDEIQDPRFAKFVPSSGALPKRVEKLERIGHSKFFKALIGDLNQLSGYTQALWIYAMNPGARKPGLPKRPILKSVLLAQKRPSSRNAPDQNPQARLILTIKPRNRRALATKERITVPRIIGYANGAQTEQELGIQIEAISKLRCHHILAEVVNTRGLSRPRRPQYRLMRKFLERGDTVVVYTFDSLAGNPESVLKIADEFKAEGVRLRSVSEPDIRPFTKKGRLQLLRLF